MNLCANCEKPVYSAEQKASVGKIWHRECLKCRACGKILLPGLHSDHKGVPYCDHPCYKNLFGIHALGKRIITESLSASPHTPSVNKLPEPIPPLIMSSSSEKRPNLDIKLKVYNEFHRKMNNPAMIIQTKEENGNRVLYGILKIHWGEVHQQIQLRAEDASKVTKQDWRRSTMADVSQVNANGGLALTVYGTGNIDLDKEDGSNNTSPVTPALEMEDPIDEYWQKTIEAKESTVTRKRIDRRHQNRSHRRSIINGHIFDVDTSVFKPLAGAVTTVSITSSCTAPRVIRLLFDKFRVLNDPANFCLCINKANGERLLLRNDDCPLLHKILLGPIDEESMMVLTEKSGVQEVSPEVAPFFILPEAVLHGFLDALQKEEESIVANIRARYELKKRRLDDKMAALEQKNKVPDLT